MAVCTDWDDENLREKAPIPRVAVAVIVCRSTQVLVCRRNSKLCNGEHALPGGFLKFGETLEECATREVKKESGLKIQNVEQGSITNTVMMDENLRPAHYVTVYMKATPAYRDDEPETLEPEKCDDWKWVDWSKIPRPIFKPLEELLNTSFDPFNRG